MVAYYSIWFLICIMTFFFRKGVEFKFIYLFFLFLLTLFVGLRFEIGGDWKNYLVLYDFFYGLDLKESFFITDPGYGFFNYLGQYFNFKDTIFVNFLCAICFFSCFLIFQKKFENYWIPLLVSFPYLILVVSMGYTRQSVAISFFLIAMMFGVDGRIFKFLFFSFLALLFHKSAIIFLVFVPFFIWPNVLKKPPIFYIYTFISFLLITLVVYISSISGENIYTNRSGEVSSAGALFRIVMHFVPLIFFIFYRKLIKNNLGDRIRLLDYLALFVIYIFVLAIPFSTLADRFNLYLIVFDIFVFCYLSFYLNTFNRQFMLGLVILANTLMLFIWLNFGAWSGAWLPYENYLLNYILESF